MDAALRLQTSARRTLDALKQIKYSVKVQMCTFAEYLITFAKGETRRNSDYNTFILSYLQRSISKTHLLNI